MAVVPTRVRPRRHRASPYNFNGQWFTKASTIMGLTSDTDRRISQSEDATVTAQADRKSQKDFRKTVSVEETFRLILDQARWEPMEPLVADVKQNEPVRLPEWFVADLFAKGQLYFRNNVFSMLGGKLVGLVALLRVNTITRILHGTKRSMTDRKALKRYADTIKTMVIWYDQDPSPQGSWADSLLEVRKKHARVAVASQTLRDEVKEPPLSQFDLAMTQFAFCGAILLRPKELGLEPTPDDIHGFIHFWKVIGYLMGLRNKYNLCNEDQDTDYTIKLIDFVRVEVFSPLLLQPHTDVSEQLTTSLINGLWCMVPLLEVTSFETIVRELLVDMDEDTIASGRQALKRTPAILRYLFFSLTGSLHNPILGRFNRIYHNNSIRFGMYMIQNYPLLAWWKFGFSYRPSTG